MGLTKFMGKILSPTQAQALSVLVVSFVACSPNWRACCLVATGCFLVLVAWAIGRWWVPAPPVPNLQYASKDGAPVQFPTPAEPELISGTNSDQANKVEDPHAVAGEVSPGNSAETVTSALPFPEVPPQSVSGAANDSQLPNQGGDGSNQVTGINSAAAAAPVGSSSTTTTTTSSTTSHNNSGATISLRRRLHSTSEEPAPSLGGWSPSTYLARFGRFQVLEQPSGRLLAPNTPEPIPFENDCFVGRMLVLVRTTPEDETHRAHFAGKPRLFELQIQGRFKQKPMGVLYMGNELPTPHLRLGMVLNATVRNDQGNMDSHSRFLNKLSV